MPMTDLEKLQAQRKELEAKIEEIDTQILELKRERQQELLAELKALGLDVLPQTRKAGDRKERERKDVPCPICKFKTSPLHDARSHRQQNPKKAFTESELTAKGLAKVS